MFWPGLEGTDRDYAWALIAYSVLETAVMPVSAVLLKQFAFTITMLLVVSIYAVGGAVYALAMDVWMVILARGLMGGAALFSLSVVHTYIGEMGTVMDEIRKKNGKSPMKSNLYIVLLVSLCGGGILTFGK